MAEVVVSFIFAKSVGNVWKFVRNFNSLPTWLQAVGKR